MEKNLKFIKVFLIGVALSIFSFSPFILDLTLTSRFIILSALALLLIILLRRSGRRLDIIIDLPLFFYLSFVAFCCLSLIWSNTRSETLFESSKLILSLFVFAFTYLALKQNSDLFTKGLFKLSIAFVFISSVFAIWQFSRSAGLDKASLYNITGINGHKNLYSSFLFLNLFFLIRAYYSVKGLEKTISAVSIILTLALLILLKTKAVWIGSIITGLTYAILHYSKKINFKLNFYTSLIGCLIFANLFFLFILPKIVEKELGANTQATSLSVNVTQKLDIERLALWEKTYLMIKKYPVLGVGMGNWQIHFPENGLSGIWRAEDLNYTFQRPHNDFLWILSETGLVGFNLYLLFLLSILLLLLKALRLYYNKNKPAFELILCFAFIVGYCSISFFDFPKERIEHMIWISIICGTAYFYIRNNAERIIIEKIDSNSVYTLSFIALLFSGCIGILRYKGEFYTREMYNHKALKQDANAIRSGYKALSFAYSIDPTSVPINWYTANSHANLGNYENAQKDFLLALKFNPFNRNVLNDLGSSYAMGNNDELAKKYYYESARISPRFDDAKLNLTAIFIKEKHFRLADSCLGKLLHESERQQNYKKMVDAFRQSGY